MKPNYKNPLLAAVIAITLTAPSAFAANLWWDSNGTGTAGAGATPTGTWATGGSAFWTTDSTGANIGSPVLTATTTASDDLFFSAGNDAGTFTITTTSPSLVANSLTFEEGATSFQGNLGVITLTTGNIQVNSVASAAIGSPTSTSAIFSGTNGLTKTGGGILSFNGNTIQGFTGGLNVLGGTLTISLANRNPPNNMVNPTNALVIGGGGTVTVGGRNTASTNSNQTFAGVTVNAGGGQLTSTKRVTATATTTVNFGTLTATATGGSLLVGVTPAGLAPVTTTTTSNKDATDIYGGRVVYSNGTANTGFDWATSATSTGPGTPNDLASYASYTAMPLSGGSSTTNYSTSTGGSLSGALDVNTLKVDGSATDLALDANTLTIASGGLLSAGTTAQTISGTAGATRLTAGTGSGSYDLIVHQYNSGGLTIGAVIGDNGGNAVTLVKAGTGNLTLTGANTYVGATYVNGGGLEFQGSIGNTSSIVNNGTLTFSTSNQSFGNVISGLGSLIKTTNATTLTLTGNNTYTGTTTIKDGTLVLDTAANRISTAGSAVLGDIATSGKLVLGGTTPSDQTLASLTTTGLGGSVVGGNAANSTLTLNIASGTNTFGGTLGGAGTNENNLALTKTGAGTQILSGSNTHTGTTTITAGTLSVGVAANLGNVASNLVFNGGTLQVTGTTLTSLASLSRTVVFNADKTVGLDIADALNTFTVGQVLDQVTGGFTKSGLGRVILNQANTYSGNTTISAGTLRLENLLAVQNSAVVSISNRTLEVATNTAFSSSTPLSINGGTIVSDVFSGSTGVEHAFGNLAATHTTHNFTAGAGVSPGTAAIKVASLTCGSGSGGSATFNPTTANLIIVGNATGANTGISTFNLGGTSTGNSIGGAVENGTRTTQNVTKSNTSIWALNGVNTYSGNTTVSGGTLTLSNAASATNANTGNDASTVTISDNGTSFLNLTYAGTDVVTKLFIGATEQLPGVYGRLLPVVPGVTGIAQITGPGTLSVGLGYSAWATLNGAGPNLNDDHDNDGVDNGTEYFIGGPSGNTTGFTPLPGVTNTAGVLSVTWTKAANYTGIYGTDFSVETSATLTGVWATETSGVTVTFPSATEVKYTFPAGTINFARLKVTGP